MKWCDGKDRRVKIMKWREPLVSGPSSKSLAQRQVCYTQTCFLHSTSQLPLGHPILHSNTLKAEHSNACWTFLCQVSSTSFLLLMWQRKLHKVFRMLICYLPHSLLSTEFSEFYFLEQILPVKASTVPTQLFFMVISELWMCRSEVICLLAINN